MKTGHTLKRVTFKEGSNSEVVVISRVNEGHEKKMYTMAMMHQTLLDILESYKKQAIRTLKPYVLDFQLFRLNGELEKKIQMVINADAVRVRFAIHRTAIDLSGLFSNEASSFSSLHVDEELMKVLVNFINTDIQTV